MATGTGQPQDGQVPFEEPVEEPEVPIDPEQFYESLLEDAEDEERQSRLARRSAQNQQQTEPSQPTEPLPAQEPQGAAPSAISSSQKAEIVRLAAMGGVELNPDSPTFASDAVKYLKAMDESVRYHQSVASRGGQSMAAGHNTPDMTRGQQQYQQPHYPPEQPQGYGPPAMDPEEQRRIDQAMFDENPRAFIQRMAAESLRNQFGGTLMALAGKIDQIEAPTRATQAVDAFVAGNPQYAGVADSLKELARTRPQAITSAETLHAMADMALQNQTMRSQLDQVRTPKPEPQAARGEAPSMPGAGGAPPSPASRDAMRYAIPKPVSQLSLLIDK